MERLLALLPDRIDYMLLLLLRVSGLIFSSPIFGRQVIPQRSKVAFCVAVAVVMLYTAPVVEIEAAGLIGYGLKCLSELLFGVILGFITTMFFGLTFTAGHLIDMQIGFGMVNIYDPQTGTQVPVTGDLYNIAMMMIFFTAGGHLRLVEWIWRTMEVIPVGQVRLNGALGLLAVDAFANAFLLAMRVAMPVIASGLLAEAALGVIIRSVPQMNMFVVGLPLKVLIGLLMFVIVLPAFIRFTPVIFESMFASIDHMFEGLISS